MVTQLLLFFAIWVVLCFAAAWVFALVMRPKRFESHADEAIGLTAPPESCVQAANRVELSEHEVLAFQDLTERFHGSYYVAGPEVSDD